MEDSGANRDTERRLGMRPHDEFLELCAVSTSGDLSDEERKKLEDHLAGCPQCRQTLKEFEAVADVGVPLLSSELAPIPSEHPNPAPSEMSGTIIPRSPAIDGKTGPEFPDMALIAAHRNGHGRTHVNWNYVWVSLAAGVLLTVALGLYSYEAGKRHNVEVVQLTPAVTDTRVEALEQQMSDVGHERAILKAQLAERDKVIASLRREVEQELASLNEMKSAQANLEQSLQSDEAQQQLVSQERASLTQKLDSAQASLQKVQAELDSVRQQKSEEQLRAASFGEQIKDFSSQLRDREQTINKQEELLAHDRDIRDLMGARDLYIAEVYDVARDGATQKPYGRVFYTKGKSLIFYAYDLDQQANVKNASTFQAWGRRGADKEQALNLGIFYEDKAAKKRWVLKFDNARTLEQIDAVFVTVEPNGGSHRPSGKPLLFAYLKVDPNHP
jgi:predicted  nucleic acid-binding Zn-ribbon protein